MKYLKIQNHGELDVRLVALMGGTTKSNDAYKIGQFGTGLKYTLAYLFRNNLDFKIYVGENLVNVTLDTEEIIGEKFDIICINGHRTSITTKMGEDWKAWMIVRELWCNALDEGCAVKDEVEITTGTAETTTFFIQIDSQIRDVLKNWNKYFIHEQTPIFEDGNYALYPAGDHLCIYKQGILIYEDEKSKAVFGYDDKTAYINELRQLQYAPSYCITSCLYRANVAAASYFIENVTEKHYEGTEEMSYAWYGRFSDAWKEAIGGAKLIYRKVVEDLKARGNSIDMTGMIMVPKVVYLALSQQFEGIGALRVASTIGDFLEDYDEKIERCINKAVTILEACNYTIHPDLEFRYGYFEDKSVLAKVSLDKKIVFFSKTLLQRPLIDVVATVIEENEHFNTGMSDNTREFQQHFIDLYTRSLLAQNQIEI